MDDKQLLVQSYEELPYPSIGFAYPLSSPRRTAAIAKLFGHTPPNIETARVLELGCASANNLIPLAASLPNAKFFGIDIAASHIDAAIKAIKDTKLTNIQVDKIDLMNFDVIPKSYDYIICHGVYSWVGSEVQDRILEICHRALSDNGLAYISYNTYPGWHMIASIRNMMRFHSEGFDNAQEKIAHSRALLNFVSSALSNNKSPFAMLMQQEAKRLEQVPDSYLYHDLLEHENHPSFFLDFIENAQKHSLQYLAEADPRTMVPFEFSPKIAQTLNSISGDHLRMEQYLDFMRNTQFRKTILCKDSVKFVRKPTIENVADLYVASVFKETTPQPGSPEGIRKFIHRDGSFLELSDATAAEALHFVCSNSPRWIPVRNVISYTAKALKLAEDEELKKKVGAALIQLSSNGGIHLYEGQCPMSTTLTNKPNVLLSARFEAFHAKTAINLAHQPIKLSNFATMVIQLCDGSNTRDQLLSKLIEHCDAGHFTPSKDGKPVTEKDEQKQIITKMLDNTLKTMQKCGFFTSKS